MDHRFLEHIYQQWAHGMSNATARWMDFVTLAARQVGVAQDDMLIELKKYSWFKWGDQ